MSKALEILKIFEDEMPAEMSPADAGDMEPAAADAGADPVMGAADKLADMAKDGIDEQAIQDFLMSLEDMPDADKMMVLVKALAMACPPEEEGGEGEPAEGEEGKMPAEGEE
jgi:hypothetical protein